MSTVQHAALGHAVELEDRGFVGRSFRESIAGLPRSRVSLIRRVLPVADIVGLATGFLLASAIWGSGDFLLFFATLPGWLILAKLHGLYERDDVLADHSTVDDLVGVFHVVTIGVWLIVVAALAIGSAQPPLGKLTAFWLVAFLAVTGARAAARSACRRTASSVQRTIIVGAGDIGQLVARKLTKHPEYGLSVVGFVDSEPKRRRRDLDTLEILGEPGQLRELIARHGVDRVVVAFSKDPAESTLHLIRDLADVDVQIDVVPRLFENVGTRTNVHSVEGLPLVRLSQPQRRSLASRAVKRAIDIVVAGVALVLLSPLLAYIAWRVKRDSDGPALFRQPRLGFGMREFEALKFRTMKVDTDQGEHRNYIREVAQAGVGTNGNGLFKLERSDAITSFGRWLRKTSLDELPQLLNVLRGDMSLVGPRPCIPYETETFRPHHFERFLVPAGITGLWQVTARAHSTFAEALEMDVSYARGWSLGLDLRLLLRTPVQLLRQRTATA